ncbi:MAG: radical SAM protein [Nanoarchaeota archaeon]|nr:radical SAM protein [Nanoarchaeota archaeon]
MTINKKLKAEDFFLRFAITPNCNFRCDYCNPEGKKEFSGILSDDEIMQIMRSGMKVGINSVHWTGGEPTLRDMEKLIQESKDLGYVDQVLTTNGSKGGDYVRKMAQKGVDRLIVSLDTVNPHRFKEITKVDCLDKVIDTIKTSVEILEQPTKMNIVYLEETKDEIPELIYLAKQINQNHKNKGNLIIKFIEMTEMNPAFGSEDGIELYEKHHTGKDVMMAELRKYGTLEPVKVIGNNPNTRYYHMPELNIKVGMINIPSQNYRCGGNGCKKIRLNPYGSIAVCVNQVPISIKGMKEEKQVEIIDDLITYRGLIDHFYPVRKHKQEENFGYWRFGNCGSTNTQ